jgi:hypothetical protein
MDKLGQVTAIDFLPLSADSAARLKVDMQILEEYRPVIRRDAVAQVRAGGSLVGAPVVYFTAGTVRSAMVEPGDTVRAKPGSFERALKALGLLNEAVREQRQRGGKVLTFGIDSVVVRSNFHQLEEFCTAIAPRFPELKFLSLGAAVPSGLANRPGYADHELLTDDQLWLLGSPGFARHLQSLAPASVKVGTFGMEGWRWRPVVAMALTVPFCRWGNAELKPPYCVFTWPPSRALSAGPEPLNGTCVISTPPFRFTITPTRCVEEPMPPDAYETLDFFARSSSSSSVFACTLGCAMSTTGPSANMVTPVKSFSVS